MTVLSRIGPRTALACALVLVPAAGSIAGEPAAEGTSEAELFFELKLLLRRPGWLGTAIVDQWAGGRLLARALPVACSGAGEDERCGTRLELLRPLVHPWTFRWYDSKDEVKLGAAIWVRDPVGEPYAALAPLLEPLARQRYERWWNADGIEEAGDRQPEWASEVEGFWARAHAREAERRDPLHPDPVYPFWVLGDPTGRFAVEVTPAGAIVESAVVERMSEPWRPAAWSAWQRGQRAPGYGYWAATDRPRWEPRTYQAFAAAFGLLAWSVPEEQETGRSVEPALDRGGVIGRAAAVVEALSPRAGGRLRWRAGPTVFRITDARSAGSTLVRVAETGPESLPQSRDGTWRAWRHTRLGGSPRRPLADEIWLLAGDPEGTRFRLWIRVGYRPVASARPSPAAARADSPPLGPDSADPGPR